MIYDLIVIGGGINGAGIARDAAGRGLSVLLAEKDDLAEHTSSASSKLIHGGLRYLEHHDFPLVRHALKEREVLLRAAPHIIWPLRFILPHHKSLRPRWLIRLGLFLYDHLGGRELLPGSHSVDLRQHIAGRPLKPGFVSGFEYSDCWVQDSRLVVLNAMDAAARGAQICTLTEVVGLQRLDQEWVVQLLNQRTRKTDEVRCRALVNAAGPWVEEILNLDERSGSEHRVRLVKGSHIIVRSRFDHPYAYIFQNADQRIVFALPYENGYTLIGTTDVEIDEPPGRQQINADEIEYLCSAASEYFSDPITPDDVVWSYSGVRPLYDDDASNASKVTRDYKLELDTQAGAPILSVFGGKITTFRKLAEQVLDMLAPYTAQSGGAWTAGVALPGGDLGSTYEVFLKTCLERWSDLPAGVVSDLARNHGTCIEEILRGVDTVQDLGIDFGGGLYQREVDYLIDHEWSRSAEDILWRRSRKGLRIAAAGTSALEHYLAARLARHAS